MLTFGASRCSSRLTGGTTNGPMAAGREVDQPLAVGCRASRRWPRAPSAEVGVEDDADVVEAGAARSARRRPSSVVGTPQPRGAGQPVGVRVDADHRGHLSVLGGRRTLIIRSVPMLPEPMMATFVFITVSRPRRRHADRGPSRLSSATTVIPGVDRRPSARARRESTTSPARSGSPSRAAVARASHTSAVSGSPRQAAPLPADTTWPLTVSAIVTSPGSNADSANRAVAQHVQAAGGVVGDRVGDRDVPAGDAAVDDLERARRAWSTAARTGSYVRSRSVEVGAEHEGDLGLDLRLQQARGVGTRRRRQRPCRRRARRSRAGRRRAAAARPAR